MGPGFEEALGIVWRDGSQNIQDHEIRESVPGASSDAAHMTVASPHTQRQRNQLIQLTLTSGSALLRSESYVFPPV